MGGGLLVLAAYALVGAGKLASLRRRPVRLAAVWSWALSFATVVIAGYAIELEGAASKPPPRVFHVCGWSGARRS
jgi:hypothetical protein